MTSVVRTEVGAPCVPQIIAQRDFEDKLVGRQPMDRAGLPNWHSNCRPQGLSSRERHPHDSVPPTLSHREVSLVSHFPPDFLSTRVPIVIE